MLLRELFRHLSALTFLAIISDTIAVQYVFDSLSVPCSFWDTVNITDATIFSNGSYLHKGRIYPKEYVGIYDYQFLNLSVKAHVKPHLRGCICKMANCVRLCCPEGQYFDHLMKICRDSSIINISTLVNVTNSKKYVDEVELNSKFAFVYGQPCDRMYDLNPVVFDYDHWDLFENGTIYRWDDHVYIDKNDYCLSPTSSSPNASTMFINPFVCFPHIEDDIRYSIYGIAMLTSVPFLLITIIIYLAIPELRNLHGKALCCYLSCLVIGYICLGYTLIEGGIIATDPLCEYLGYTAYFSFMSSFLWLSVISFDLWWNFRIMTTRGQKNELKRFIMYSIYSWGLAFCFTAATFIVQKSNIPDEWKPGIGGGQLCWIETADSWIGLIYFYGQIIVIITFNVLMFILTTYKIHHVKRETSKVMGREDSRRNISREKDNVGLFLRLFIVMGVTWSMDIISWILGKHFKYLFYITDICNAIQGLIIFILFVMKNKVKRLLIKRYNSFKGMRGKDTRTSQYSTKTSSVTMTTPTVVQDKTELSLMPAGGTEVRDNGIRAT